ncbi:MAG: hypothetical protein O7F76_07700, partial [Planctomycetota bacterium]|nr:hypothetical protein [Planctomycetota bacterium]
MESEPQDADALRRKMEILESENIRLKKRVESVFGPDNPNFDPQAFMKAMRRYMGFIWLSFALAMLFLVLAISGKISVPNIPVGPTVLIDPGGMF